VTNFVIRATDYAQHAREKATIARCCQDDDVDLPKLINIKTTSSDVIFDEMYVRV